MISKINRYIFFGLAGVFLFFNPPSLYAQQIDPEKLLVILNQYRTAFKGLSNSLSDLDAKIEKNYDIARACIVEFEIKKTPGDTCDHFFSVTTSELARRKILFANRFSEVSEGYEEFFLSINRIQGGLPFEHRKVTEDLRRTMNDMLDKYEMKVLERQPIDDNLDTIREFYDRETSK